MTSLSYSCIANGRTLLAELSLRGGCFRVQTAPREQRASRFRRGLLCGLASICKAFIGSPLISQVTFAHPFEFNADFQQVLGKYMMEYNRKSGDITVSTLQIQVDDVKNVMTQNIDKVLQREENLSELVDRTDDLQIASETPRTQQDKNGRSSKGIDTMLMPFEPTLNELSLYAGEEVLMCNSIGSAYKKLLQTRQQRYHFVQATCSIQTPPVCLQSTADYVLAMELTLRLKSISTGSCQLFQRCYKAPPDTSKVQLPPKVVRWMDRSGPKTCVKDLCRLTKEYD
ncbi:Vesicle-associated membrane protein 7 [Chelonia mydas]|uniref:Vesicle-associated membrane protein 7 n=1 Tax=Chelonia mydas TaxID=8469 RepID=M7BE10_CHEMY|nr:Vesicle-associated membrane protein 7 [Chelonia mydas]